MTANDPPTDVRQSVDAMLLAAGGSARPVWRRMRAEARHGLWRVDAGGRQLVLKVYHAHADRFFHHRWRREERALDLAARHAPGLAPTPHGAWLMPGAWAALAMDDLGAGALADRLAAATQDERSVWLGLSLDALRRFEALTTRFAGMFRALAYQSDLDRITTETLRQRYANALTRLQGAEEGSNDTLAPRRLVPHAPWDEIDRWLVRPLARAPRRVIHNGFSPLNLIEREGRVAVLDWETLAVAPRECDLADLLTFGGWGIDADAVETRVAEHLGVDRRSGRALELFWKAAAERCLTYAATAHVRAARKTVSSTRVQTERRGHYLAMFRVALERGGLPAAARRHIAAALPDGLETGAGG